MKGDPKFLISRAKTWLMSFAPFYGSMALFMEFVERKDLNPPTMATDGTRIYYHPDFVTSITKEECAGVIAHEVLHRVLKHHLRRGLRDPLKWNIAADLAINPLLVSDGFKLPAGALISQEFQKMSSEAIYNRLPDQKGGGGGKGSGKGAGTGSGQDWGQVMDAPGIGEMTEAEQHAAETEVDIATRQAATAAKMAGKLPGHLSEFIEAATEPKVDWRERIRTVVGHSRPDDFTWSRPNRSILGALGLYLPGMRKSGCGPIVVVIDTSGSISDKEASAYLAEINGIIEECSPEKAILIQCDTHIRHIEEKTDGQPLTGIKIHGRGGTDFREPFKWVEKQDFVPDALVYLTDLYGSEPEEAPPYPVYWVCTTDLVAKTGETIPIRV